MNRAEFKQRMQQYKAYKEQNPDARYLQWKEALPKNLQDDTSYNLRRAYELDYEPITVEGDTLKHLPTRDWKTGEILKKPWHPTYTIGLMEDARLGYYPKVVDGTTYTTTWEGNENSIFKYEDGGEVGGKKEPPYPSFYNGRRVNRWTGEPLATGAVKAAFDIEDAANLTPVGDAITVKDMSQAVLNKDWAGLGIASLGLIPVVGTGLGKVITRGVRGIAKNIERESTDAVRRSVPTVNKDRFTRQLNKVIEKMQQEKGSLRDPNYKISDISDANNARNEVLGDLNKEYFDKARAVDAQYGTDYENTYKKILDAYNDPVEYMQNTPYVKYEDLGIDNQGKINFAPDDERAFEIAVENSPAKLKDYVVTAGKNNATKGTIYHEMSHLVDGMQNPGGTFDIKDNKLLWEAGKEKHFKLFKEYNNAVSNAEKISEYNYRYLTNPFEMKAFVNTARSDMAQLGILNKRTQSATKEQINSYLQHPEAHGSLKKLFKLHKDPDQFYKMFNAMPYLGLTGLGVYNLYQYDTKNNGQYIPNISDTNL